MKKIYLIFFVVLAVLQLKAQLDYDKNGGIIPFSQVEKYKKIIEEYELKTYNIPWMNNDSLCRKYNKGKSVDELDNQFVDGISYEKTPFDIKEIGTSIKMQQGTLWLYTIESPSAEDLGVSINIGELPQGAYLAIIAPDTLHFLKQPPKVYSSENIPVHTLRNNTLTETVIGKKIIIEYFEPNNLSKPNKIVIKNIIYGFVKFGAKNMINSSSQKPLKSGYWGDSEYSQCQNDVICLTGWQNEANSVVFLRLDILIDEDSDGVTDYRNRKRGTGFFLNKVGNYSEFDYPIMITAGHLFATELDGSLVDGYNYEHSLLVVCNYENEECGNDDNFPGIVLPSIFNRLTLGSDYNLFPYMAEYNASDDYAVLQPTGDADVGTLSNYNIEYAAWSKNYDLSNSNNVGYTCIHHPKGDVKKINKDNNNATTAVGGDFYLYYDLGLTEDGSSGAPVFNSLKQVVGWHTAASDTKDCNLIGSMRTTNGSFINLYYQFSFILDPNNIGEATSSNPAPPTPPAHCGDCILNYDETDIDCGGVDCYPCGMLDVVTLKTPMDIPGNTAKSRYELFAEPDPNTLLALKSGSYTFEAGMNIHLNGGFEVEKGAEFYAGIDAELMSEPNRGCGGYCANAPSVSISPNGDGINDYWAFSQAFAVKYDLRIFDRANNTYYSVNNQPIYENGWVLAWDGTGAVSNVITYYGTLTLTDCNGHTHQEDFVLGVAGLKSAFNSEEEITDVENIDSSDAKITVYPNPSLNDVTINFFGKTFPLEYKILDINGKVVIQDKMFLNIETINLRSLAPGTYIINAKAGDYNLIQKLVKK
jgi:hypothetical protein